MEPTPGKTTSEYKIVLVEIIGTVAAAVTTALAGHPKVALAMAGVAAFVGGVYAVCRTWLKAERVGKVDVLTPAQEATLEKALRAVGTLSDVLKMVLDDKPDAEPSAEDPDDSVTATH